MSAKNIEVVKGYTELLDILSSRYEFECRDGILYGINLTRLQEFKLAYKTRKSSFVPVEGIRGQQLVELICQKFNANITKELALGDINILFKNFFELEVKTLGRLVYYSKL